MFLLEPCIRNRKIEPQEVSCQDRMLRQIAGQNSERHRPPTLSERLVSLLAAWTESRRVSHSLDADQRLLTRP